MNAMAISLLGGDSRDTVSFGSRPGGSRAAAGRATARILRRPKVAMWPPGDPRTALPCALPPGVQKDRVHVIEGSIITWTKQIKEVLKLDPETILKQGVHAGPSVELEFWEGKATNLNSIFNQLQSESVMKAVGMNTKAIFYPTMRMHRKLQESVNEGLSRIELTYSAASKTSEENFFNGVFHDQAVVDLNRVELALKKVPGLVWHLPTKAQHKIQSV